jgi:hypothetical protein
MGVRSLSVCCVSFLPAFTDAILSDRLTQELYQRGIDAATVRDEQLDAKQREWVRRPR